MKIIIFIFIVIYSNLSIFGQKKELYVNDDLKHISKMEFENKQDDSLNYNLKFDLDSCYLNVRVSRYKKGKIKLSVLDSIKNTFGIKNQKGLIENSLILINYYPGNDNCSSYNYKTNFKNKYTKFINKINKIDKLEQLFIYKSDYRLKEFGNKINWQLDKYNIIEKTFYPIHYPCGGYVIIDNKGNYTSERGEYCYSKTLIKEIKKFTNKN